MGEKKRDNASSVDKSSVKEAMIRELELQIIASLWFQSFAQLIEASAVTKLYDLEGPEPGALEVVQGVWIQAIGQMIESIGASQQFFSKDHPSLLRGQRNAINGDWMQSIGAAVEATGGERILRDAIRKDGNGFVP